jgi:hypothetical protein
MLVGTGECACAATQARSEHLNGLDAGVAHHAGVNPVVLNKEIWVMMKLTQSLSGH